jgi:NADH dehydrogenase
MAAAAQDKLVTIIGGSGFVGRHLVQALAKRGYRIRVACRRPDLAGFVLPLGTPGQIALTQANVRFPASVLAACEGASTVVNLTGVLFGAGAQSFDAIHVFGADAVAKAAKQAGAGQLIHMSAIGSDAKGASDYARSKAEGERLASAAFPGAVIIRPSVVFGPEDDFFNRFASMARFSPALPLIGGGVTRLQPVFVGDVTEAMARLIDQGSASGKTYELGGPSVVSLKGVLDYVLETVKRKRLLVPVPFPVAKMLAHVTGLLPKPPLTVDQVALLRGDNVVSAEATREGRSLQGLGISPQTYQSVVPSYLYRYRKAGQFTDTQTQTS